MNKKITILVASTIFLLVVAIVVSRINLAPKNIEAKSNAQNGVAAVAPKSDSNVKEFSMNSFTLVVDGKYKPQYSLKDITVNKGDKVRIKITVTGGMHDFKIDEYNIYADTQPGKEYVVEFTADKAGDFIYYCTKPGHRQNGHWGTLHVLNK